MKKFMKLTTITGRKVKATGNHPFLTRLNLVWLKLKIYLRYKDNS